MIKGLHLGREAAEHHGLRLKRGQSGGEPGWIHGLFIRVRASNDGNVSRLPGSEEDVDLVRQDVAVDVLLLGEAVAEDLDIRRRHSSQRCQIGCFRGDREGDAGLFSLRQGAGVALDPGKLASAFENSLVEQALGQPRHHQLQSRHVWRGRDRQQGGRLRAFYLVSTQG